MANKRIDQLPINSNALKDTDLIPIWDVINNKTEKVSLNTLSNFIVGVSGDTYVESGIYVSSASTINLYRNDDVVISINGITTSSTFTGNTSATCISELWVSSISGCSPVYIGPQIITPNITIAGGVSATTITPAGINTPSLNVGGVPYSASCQTLFIKKSLVPAQISGLTTPMEMIPAPGPGKAIQIIAANARKIYDTTPYNNGVGLILKYSGTTCFGIGDIQFCRWGHTSGLMGSAYNTDTYGTFTQEDAYENSWSPNVSVTLHATTNPGGAGDSSLDIYITYKIITL